MNAASFRVIAAPFTPFHEDGSLNAEGVKRQAEWLVRDRVAGAFVAGTTGECASLSPEERLELTRTWIRAGSDLPLEIIVQVGDNSQAHAIRLAADAQQAGADATAAYAPFYFRPTKVAELIDFLAPIAAAAGDIPFYFYEIPGTTGVRLDMVEFLEKAKPRMPNLVGLKYSNTDLIQLQACLSSEEGDFEFLFGCDEMLLAGVVLGVHGAIGATYNFAAPLYQRMLAALACGDLPTARECQWQSAALVRCLNRYGFLAAAKSTMSFVGLDCGPVRAPLRNLTRDEQQSLRADLEQWGIDRIRSLSGETAGASPLTTPS